MDSLHGIQGFVAFSIQPKTWAEVVDTRSSSLNARRCSTAVTRASTGVGSVDSLYPWKLVMGSESSRRKCAWKKYWLKKTGMCDPVRFSCHRFKLRLVPTSLCSHGLGRVSKNKRGGGLREALCRAGGGTLAGKNEERITREHDQTPILPVAGNKSEANDGSEEEEEAAAVEQVLSEEELEYEEDLYAVLHSEVEENENAGLEENFLDRQFESESSGRSDSDSDLSDRDNVGVVAVANRENNNGSSLVAELCRKVQANDGFTVSASDIAALYEFPIDRFQRLAIEAFLKGLSLVVCAPTSSGKTLIAEAASAATLSKKQRLFYTTPLKALSNQKLREFRKMFGEANVGLLTGDVAVNREAPIMVMTTEILRNMLYQSPPSKEKGGDGSGGGRSRLENVSAVVLDEVHYLSDISRGTVWEETVIYCPKDVQLICLSATVANPEDLAGWIAQVHGPTELVTGTRRPVPLTWHFSTRYELQPLLNEQGTKLNWRLLSANSTSTSVEDEQELEESRGRRRGQVKKKLLRGNGSGNGSNGSSSSSNGRITESRREGGSKGRSGRRGRGGWEDEYEEPPPLSAEALQFIRRRQVPRVQDTLEQLRAKGMLPAIWFIFSRRGCDTAVRYLEEVDLLSDEESQAVKEAIANFEKENPDAVRRSAVAALRRGIAAHHAGCLPAWKSFVEELFQQGLVKVVFATETLAAGINMPARTTVLSSLSKRGEAGHTMLTTNAMLQMAGRAGRRGIDEQGHVVVVQTPFEGAEDCCNLLFAGVDPLVSQFSATYGMALNLLAGGKVAKSSFNSSSSASSMISDLPSVPFGRSLDDARELIEQSFGNYVGSEVVHAARKQAAKLEDEMNRLVQRAHAESSSQLLATRLTRAELNEYLGLKDQVKLRKGDLQKMLSEMDVSNSAHQTFVNDNLNEAPPLAVREGDESASAAAALESLVVEKRKEISSLRKMLKRTQGYRENHQLVVLQKSRLEKIARLANKASKIRNRIKQMAPSGWKEFLQVVEVLNEIGAVNMENNELLPLGQAASAIRGTNELWLAIVFTSESVSKLTSSELAAVCGSLVSEGLKPRSEVGSSGTASSTLLYEASTPVQEWLASMETELSQLEYLQSEHGVQIPCHVDIQFAGMVEAWAAGLTWRELTSDCGMDEGDVARLLRRSIDLLAQIPHMPHVSAELGKLATQTTSVMDRPPISDLLG